MENYKKLTDVYKKLTDTIIQDHEDYKKITEDYKKITADHIAVLNKEILQAKGLMTSRGIFEWILSNVFMERTRGRRKFNASGAIDLLEKVENGML